MDVDSAKSLVGSNGGYAELNACSTLGLLARLVEAATIASSSDREHARRALEYALALLTAGRESFNVPRLHPPRGGLAPWQATRVAAYVSEHIGGSLRTRELAALLRLSYSHFNRAFKVSFRETPTAYVMRQRVRPAKDKMLSTGDPLSRVALECGLCDQAHFSRLFRRVVGQSPRLWRRQFAPNLRASQMNAERAAH